MTVQLHGALRHVLAEQIDQLARRITADLRSNRPDQAARHGLDVPGTINPGLLLHRLWLDVDRTQAKPDDVRNALQAAQLRAVGNACRQLPGGLLDSLHARRRRAATALAARHPGWIWRLVRIEPMWRLVVGHGADSVHESSLTLSPTYGLPVLPGTALKGLAAAMAWENGWTEQDTTLFGSPRPDRPADARRGSVLIWDALPIRPPELVLDVLTPHVKGYYDAGNAGRELTAAPAEYHNPVPVRFLAVQQTPFRGYVIGPSDDVTRCVELIRSGLDELGLGGKTAAGYGYCAGPNDVPGELVPEELPEEAPA